MDSSLSRACDSSALVVAAVSRAPPSVHARAPSQSLPAAPEPQLERYGGSGFVVWRGARDGRGAVVMTSAKWLSHLVHIYISSKFSGPNSIPNGIEWRLKDPGTKFHIILEKLAGEGTTHTPPHGHHQQQPPTHTLTFTDKRPGHYANRISNQTRDKTLPNSTTHDQAMPNCDHSPEQGLAVYEAEIVSVHLLADVYSCLLEQLQSLSLWTCETGEGGENGGGRIEREGADDFVSVASLLLPLSCAVLLEFREPDSQRSQSSLFRQAQTTVAFWC